MGDGGLAAKRYVELMRVVKGGVESLGPCVGGPESSSGGDRGATTVRVSARRRYEFPGQLGVVRNVVDGSMSSLECFTRFVVDCEWHAGRRGLGGMGRGGS